MKCPQCQQPLSERTCTHCQALIYDSGPYCSYCGKFLQTGESDEDDWDERVLCSDGDCIGVIGPDGRCKECGKPYEEEKSEP
jgi:hypothetical protein